MWVIVSMVSMVSMPNNKADEILHVDVDVHVAVDVLENEIGSRLLRGPLRGPYS